MKILIEESVLRQAIKTLERCYDFPSDQGLRIEGTITALRTALDAAEKVEDQLATVTKERDELADAFTVLWVSQGYGERSQWDAKAIERFDALLAKVGASTTAEVKP